MTISAGYKRISFLVKKGIRPLTTNFIYSYTDKEKKEKAVGSINQ